MCFKSPHGVVALPNQPDLFLILRVTFGVLWGYFSYWSYAYLYEALVVIIWTVLGEPGHQ